MILIFEFKLNLILKLTNIGNYINNLSIKI